MILVEVGGDGEQAHQFVLAEDLGQGRGLLSTRDVESRVGSLQGDAKKEPQPMAMDIASVPAQVTLFEQEEQVILHFLGRELIGAAVIMAGQADDGVEVDVLGARGQSTNGHVVEHALAKRCHGVFSLGR